MKTTPLFDLTVNIFQGMMIGSGVLMFLVVLIAVISDVIHSRD